MKTIAYTGPSDFQEFSKKDFAKAGVEDGKALRFAQGEPTEVEDEIAEALLSKDNIFGDHLFTDLSEVDEGDTDEETEENQREVAEKAAEKAAKKSAKNSDAGGAKTSGKGAKVQSSGDGATAGSLGDTGAGTSTTGTR